MSHWVYALCKEFGNIQSPATPVAHFPYRRPRQSITQIHMFGHQRTEAGHTVRQFLIYHRVAHNK